MNRRFSILIALGPVIATGCYGNTEAFWQKASELTCKQMEECDRGAFEAQYSSMSDCIDTRTEDGIDLTSTCEYDAEQGRECIEVTKKYRHECDINLSELQEITDACADVHYSCDGATGFNLSYDPTIGQSYISSVEPVEPSSSGK